MKSQVANIFYRGLHQISIGLKGKSTETLDFYRHPDSMKDTTGIIIIPAKYLSKEDEHQIETIRNQERSHTGHT